MFRSDTVWIIGDVISVEIIFWTRKFNSCYVGIKYEWKSDDDYNLYCCTAYATKHEETKKGSKPQVWVSHVLDDVAYIYKNLSHGTRNETLPSKIRFWV